MLDAEPRFLPHLLSIHRKFPKLRIVLEHCTTSAAVECVRVSSSSPFLLFPKTSFPPGDRRSKRSRPT